MKAYLVCAGVNATQNVVYQNEDGDWVTDLAYYSSFEKEVEDGKTTESVGQFQEEDFVPSSTYQIKHDYDTMMLFCCIAFCLHRMGIN